MTPNLGSFNEALGERWKEVGGARSNRGMFVPDGFDAAAGAQGRTLSPEHGRHAEQHQGFGVGTVGNHCPHLAGSE